MSFVVDQTKRMEGSLLQGNEKRECINKCESSLM